MPNLTHLVETQNIPFNLPAKQVKINWGNHLDHARPLTVVYSNHNHRLSQHNNKQIDSIERKIQEHKQELGILKLVSTKTSPYSHHVFSSSDKKVLLLELWVPKNKLQHPNFINKIQHQCNINGLETHITSPELINHSIAENTIQKSKVAVLTTFCFALIFFLIVFKSILLPILSIIPLGISYIVSLSIIANLSQRQIIPFSANIPLLVALTVLLLGTVTTFLIYHRLTVSLTNNLGRKKRRKYALAALIIPLILIVSVISLAFLSFHWFDFLPIKALSNLIIPILITTIATISLNSIFIKIFQTKLFWPGKPQNKIFTGPIWQRLVKFSLWQPLAGIILLSLISFPLLTKSHFKFNFSNYQIAEKKLIQGQRIIQSHFNFGKSTPVTIYLKNNHKLTNEHDLAVIDHLTTKLQTMKNVASVQSVTQPGGTKVKKYYLQSQLAKFSHSLNRSNQELKLVRQSLHKINQAELNKNTINSQQNELTQLSQSINATLQLSQQESLTTDDANQINFLAVNLGRLNQLNQNGATVSDQFTQYTQTLKALNDNLQTISEKL
ncbi:RND superfamily drug exporter [Fructilactobacillus lindneri DSM 20690 = JCM 11027]|uniref:RND superfamily drug exporter n=1 Tax=Fructilactobacillus lindneri DSM 20690 = JCM 11027 TaxID=1122148 RepID=A0A0R2JSH9_9LACO|nr:RND superfamily drug exporter [Fructilactobacillus lindneri DSM 20690 = JCM 11027]